VSHAPYRPRHACCPLHAHSHTHIHTAHKPSRCVQHALQLSPLESSYSHSYGPTLLERAHDYLAARGVPLVSNQINLSLLYRKASAPTLQKCAELDVPIIAYFPLANGLLSGRYDATNLPPFPKSLTMKKYVVGGVDGFPEGGYLPLRAEMLRIADARGKTVPQVAINWCASRQDCRTRHGKSTSVVPPEMESVPPTSW
jgi:aryl-alcohol dehydrogenase-like predicted oxidoreductase